MKKESHEELCRETVINIQYLLTLSKENKVSEK